VLQIKPTEGILTAFVAFGLLIAWLQISPATPASPGLAIGLCAASGILLASVDLLSREHKITLAPAPSRYWPFADGRSPFHPCHPIERWQARRSSKL
jgi:hypothetical protein